MIRNLISLLFLSSCLGCGASTPLPPTEEPEAADIPAMESRMGVVSGVHATIEIDEVNRVFDSNMRKLLRCYEECLENLEDIEGEVGFAIEVGSGNRVTEIFVKDSDLGCLEGEQCMVRTISNCTFQRQGEGVAIVSKELSLVAPYDYPSPISFDDSVVSEVVAANQSDVEQCLSTSGGILLTLWIGKGGMVLSSGFATDTIEQTEAAHCLAKSARRWIFPDPGMEIAKVRVSF